MRMPVGMENGDAHPIAEKIREQFSSSYLGATLFRGDLSVHLKKDDLLEVCKFLKSTLDFDYPVHISSVDHLGGKERFEIVYELFSIRKHHRVRLKVRLSENDLSIASVTSVWCGADFLEREVYDMMGIQFEGHPNLCRILLPDEYDEGFPLRKDFPLEGRGWRDTFEFEA